MTWAEIATWTDKYEAAGTWLSAIGATGVVVFLAYDQSTRTRRGQIKRERAALHMRLVIVKALLKSLVDARARVGPATAAEAVKWVNDRHVMSFAERAMDRTPLQDVTSRTAMSAVIFADTAVHSLRALLAQQPPVLEQQAVLDFAVEQVESAVRGLYAGLLSTDPAVVRLGRWAHGRLKVVRAHVRSS